MTVSKACSSACALSSLLRLSTLTSHMGADCITKDTSIVDFGAMGSIRAVFVTTNEHKRREAQEILGVELEGAALGPQDVPEIQALDVAEVAADKALRAHDALGAPPHPVLVEDSGLVVAAWNGLPG